VSITLLLLCTQLLHPSFLVQLSHSFSHRSCWSRNWWPRCRSALASAQTLPVRQFTKSTSTWIACSTGNKVCAQHCNSLP
jgi:hypothetical protein